MTTNRDFINKMSNEELARFIANVSKRCPNCKYYDATPEIYFNQYCYKQMLSWLQQEREV